MTQRISAETSIRRSRWRQPCGRKLASSTGGERTAGIAGVGYAVQTAISDGPKLLIFVPRAAHSHDSSLLFVPGRPAKSLPKRTLQDLGILDLSPGRPRHQRM